MLFKGINLRGLGLGSLDYYDLLAQANLQNCSPSDSVCVSNNVAKQAAVEDLWVNNYMTHGGAPEGTVLTFTPQSDQQTTEFYNPGNLFNGGNVVDTKGIMRVVSPSGAVVNTTPMSSTVQGNSNPTTKNTYVPGAATPVDTEGSFVNGLKAIINPGEWGNVFASGDILAIVGLVGVPVLALSFMGSKR